jgi:hypothetical protein
MRRNGDIRRVADHFIRLLRGVCVWRDGGISKQRFTTPGRLRIGSTHDSPFPVRLLAREIQWDGEHINVGERTRQPATPIFEVGPIYEDRLTRTLRRTQKARERTVAIETYTHLRCDVREQERLIHGILRGRHKVRTRAREK